jgi:hypothetical protein
VRLGTRVTAASSSIVYSFAVSGAETPSGFAVSSTTPLRSVPVFTVTVLTVTVIGVKVGLK